MKKSFYLLLTVLLIISVPGNSQGLLKKVAKSMTNELLGKPENPNADMPEPKCACDKPVVAMDLGGKLQLDYKELTFSVLDDGSILAKTYGSGEYYIVKGGVTQGPIKEGDQRLKAFEASDEENNSIDNLLIKFKAYISRSGEKYIINFAGKSYGPYAQINNFTVTKSKDKFAALVIENIVVNEAQGKQMDAAINNAKTEQEKMDLAMKYAQEMQQKMLQGGGPMNTLPKLVTNVPNATLDPLTGMGGSLNGKIKYDDILVVAYDKIIDLQNNTVMKLKQDDIGAPDLFVNSANTKYAVYNYGTLTMSDNISLPELFNPYLVKEDGQVYLAYMYYSPKKNAIMQCKIVF